MGPQIKIIILTLNVYYLVTKNIAYIRYIFIFYLKYYFATLRINFILVNFNLITVRERCCLSSKNQI